VSNSFPLYINQGADWFVNFTYQDSSGNPINLSTYTANLQIRSHYDDLTPALSLAVGSGLTVNSAGVIAAHATAAQTNAMPDGQYLFQLTITSAGGVVYSLVENNVIVTPSVVK